MLTVRGRLITHFILGSISVSLNIQSFTEFGLWLGPHDHNYLLADLAKTCRFPLPLGVWEGLRFVIVALPGLFSYLFLHVKNPRLLKSALKFIVCEA